MFAVIVVGFMLIHLAPGDPVLFLVGAGSAISPEYIAAARARMGLDKPLYVQFFIYLSGLLRGDFGYSLMQGAPVLDVVLDRLPRTLLLMGLSLAIAIILGIIVGVETAMRANTKWDYLMTTVSLAGYSMPVFWLGLMFLLIFTYYLHLTPAMGIVTQGADLVGLEGLLDVLRHVFLPAMTLAISMMAFLMRLTRQGTVEALGENYILTARMKGLGERTIAYRHAFRNGILPLVTGIGMSFGFFIGWSILVEIVFGWPGLGLLMWYGVNRREYPTLMALFIIISLMTVLGNLAADIVSAKLNPRISVR
jgi:peptide/nickel transport system permease protein